MRKCPQCNTVYADDVAFCLNDGTPLIEESFSLPSETIHSSDGPETIIRHEPIVIDFAGRDEPPPAANPPFAAAEQVIVVPAQTTAVNRNYALFLILGLLIGGGLVLATLLISRSLNQPEKTHTVNINSNAALPAKTEKTVNMPTPEANENKSIFIEPANKHAEPNDNFADIANGRVIVVNARIRSAPDKDAPIVSTLPMNDRLDIIRRENENSPWYQVECEHGVNGWMHGDTIEFTR